MSGPSQLDRLSMVGVNGGKFPAIRKHLQENIGNVYKDMDVSYVKTFRACVLQLKYWQV